MAKKTFEEIKPWDGTSGTGADARLVVKENFDKVNEAIEEIEEEVSKKENSVPGKGLSTNDYDNNAKIEVEKVITKVSYTPQVMTIDQELQARTNIKAAKSDTLFIESFIDLDRVDLQDGMYIVSGSSVGLLFVAKEKLNNQTVTILQIFITSVSIRQRRIVIQDLPVYADWNNKNDQQDQLILQLIENGGGDPGQVAEYYSNANPVPSTIGGILSGSTFANRTQTQMWDALLYPYQVPSFTYFNISGQANPLEVGSTIAANRTFIWASINPDNILDSIVTIGDMTNDVVILEDTPNDGIQLTTSLAVIKTVEDNHIYRILAKNSNDEFFEKFLTIQWKYKMFHGNADNTPATSADVRALSSIFDTNSFSINITALKYVIAIPDNKTLSSVKTANFEDITSNFTLVNIDVLLVDGITTKEYKVYVLTTAESLNTTATVTLT